MSTFIRKEIEKVDECYVLDLIFYEFRNVIPGFLLTSQRWGFVYEVVHRSHHQFGITSLIWWAAGWGRDPPQN
nr:hypothetical protein [Sulfurisphaera ohwakuensis]